MSKPYMITDTPTFVLLDNHSRQTLIVRVGDTLVVFAGYWIETAFWGEEHE